MCINMLTSCTNFKKSQTPKVFNNVLEKPNNKYPNHFLESNFIYKKFF